MENIVHDKYLAIEQLARVIQELSLARDLNTVMHIVRKAARQLIGSDGATFVLRENNMCFYAEEDAIGPLWKGRRFPIETCISGWCMLNQKVAAIEDIYSDPRIPHEAYRPTFVKSLAMIPIRNVNPIGAIGNYWGHKHVASDTELTILRSLADITAVTLENIKVYAQLEQRVKDRTAELEELNQELESFSYTVSHDLKAPLRAISCYQKILLEEHADELSLEGVRIAGRVQQNAEDMTKMIDDLLNFFRTGKRELVRTEIKMNLMVESICRNYDGQNGSNVRIVIKQLPDAIADGNSLRQVWQNLISNAVKYSSKKQNPEIEIGCTQEHGTTIYYVKDNGAGFNTDYTHKLFGVFQRLHSSREFEGSGIGLATVHKIISRHGGKVWAEAIEGEGATFYFMLDAKEVKPG